MMICEFTDIKLLGKLCKVEDRILSVGSFNFNHLSEYTSVETNMQVAHPQFCQQVKKQLEAIFNEYANPVPEELYMKKLKPFNRFKLWVSYTVTTVLMKLAFAFTSKSS